MWRGCSSRDHRAFVGGVPRDRLREPVAKSALRGEAEQCLGTRRVELATRLPVRPRRIPDDLALVPRQLCDELSELSDRDLLTGAEVHRLVAVVALRSEPDAVGAVLDVQELACR